MKIIDGVNGGNRIHRMGAPSPAGWYPDPGGYGQRYWDGAQWGAAPTPLSRDQRQDRLDVALADLLRYGGRIESRTAYQAVVLTGSNPNHVVHALLTIFSCGLWAIGWALTAAWQKVDRATLYVDEYGSVIRV